MFLLNTNRKTYLGSPNVSLGLTFSGNVAYMLSAYIPESSRIKGYYCWRLILNQ